LLDVIFKVQRLLKRFRTITDAVIAGSPVPRFESWHFLANTAQPYRGGIANARRALERGEEKAVAFDSNVACKSTAQSA
jgi:hypothetical protein